MTALALAAIGCNSPRATPPSLTVCELSRDYGKYRDQLISVRGVYYYGLRQQCPGKCADGSWPSFIYLAASEEKASAWDEVAKVERNVEAEAKKGKRFEIWVIATGRLQTGASSPLGPCDIGARGPFPAQLLVDRFSDITVKENPSSPYDYGHMYHGAL
jgi:hypothetical protein